jgi:hypothetical protein
LRLEDEKLSGRTGDKSCSWTDRRETSGGRISDGGPWTGRGGQGIVAKAVGILGLDKEDGGGVGTKGGDCWGFCSLYHDLEDSADFSLVLMCCCLLGQPMPSVVSIRLNKLGLLVTVYCEWVQSDLSFFNLVML